MLHHGTRIVVPEGSQRLLVLVALRGGRVDRRRVAGSLWPNGSDDRAAGNLRSAMWRLRSAGLDLLSNEHGVVTLRERVDVDVHAVASWADRLVRGTHTDDDLVLEGRPLDPDDVLPGWYDDWVIFERERLRQRVLHGLEALSTLLREQGRCAEAVEAALCAVHLEPLRESGQRALLLAHLAEGNQVEAHRALDTYARLLRNELGLRTSAELQALLRAPRPRLSDLPRA
ncbi:AfsR/SARP family transcriptional regulator [Nocardioides flavus (ex Wang et al. 2016)]|uniref:AfsR/SARP family transcriptional regulator n=1 Tax=Nocardioides flavus (ex Wang et al. 2016) TaxID=2058780 RepID=UPI00174DA4B0|nr:bacterial transcriptional activator domain-containing protein [Nocardioides flavus (ex Wang et al. 2016)]